MNAFIRMIKRMMWVFGFIIVISLNLFVQIPNMVVKKDDYVKMQELMALYDRVGLVYDRTRIYWSLTEAARLTAVKYYTSVNNPSYKDITESDKLLLVSKYWYQFQFEDKRLKEISHLLQNIHSNVSTSSMGILELTDNDVASLTIFVTDISYDLVCNNAVMYTAVQCFAILAFLGTVQLWLTSLRDKYSSPDDDYEDYYEEEETYDEFEDIGDKIIEEAMKEVPSRDPESYFTHIQ